MSREFWYNQYKKDKCKCLIIKWQNATAAQGVVQIDG